LFKEQKYFLHQLKNSLLQSFSLRSKGEFVVIRIIIFIIIIIISFLIIYSFVY